MKICWKSKISLLLLIFATVACVHNQPSKVLKLSDLRPGDSLAHSEERSIARADLISALQKDDLIERARIVQVFRSSREQVPYPEYRIFGVVKGSVYELLGLQNADILVGANDYTLNNARVFKDYLKALANENEALVEIRREDRAIILRYKFF